MGMPLIRQRIKRAILPAALTPCKLPFGVGRGLRMEVDFQSETKIYLGLYEVELNAHLRRMCQGASTCFDVGSSVGYDSLVMAKLSGGHIVAFDFEPTAIERFKRNIALNPGLESRVQLRAHLVNGGSHGGRSLDSVIAEGVLTPDFVKIDVEGAELEVLQGSEGLLVNRMPDLLIEVHSWDLEVACIKLLRDHGYQPIVVDQRRWLKEHRPLPHNRWLVSYSANKAKD